MGGEDWIPIRRRTVTHTGRQPDENFIGVTCRISLLIGLPSMYSRSAGVQFQPGVDYIGRRPMRVNYTFRVYQFNNSGRSAGMGEGSKCKSQYSSVGTSV